MGLFRRSTKRTIEQLETVAREWWLKVPQTYPDGTPFPAREPYEGVVAAAVKITRSGRPEWAGLFCMKVLAHYATFDEVPFYKMSFMGVEASEARAQLLSSGMRTEERALSSALLLAHDFHTKAGHKVVMDVDAEGNILNVDSAGHLLDENGRVLPTDELGRAIPPEA